MSASSASPEIPITKPDLGEEEAAEVRRVLQSGWVSQGPEVERFEAEFRAFVGADHAVAVSSGTAALHVALRAVGLQPGDEVITPSHTFVATANAIRQCGAEPAFVDVELETYNMDPEAVQARLGRKTRAILAVHQLGAPCDLRRLLPLAERHGIPLIEDAACAIGSELRLADRWERIGRPHGVVACFSFHPRKVLTTGEGGMLVTNDERLAQRCRQMRNQGACVPASAQGVQAARVAREYGWPGFNYRLTDIQAALGRVQLRKLPRLIALRRERVALYRRALDGAPQLALPDQPEWARSNQQSFCVRLTDACSRSGHDVRQTLHDRGIATLPGVMCCHREPAYRTSPPASLPRSELARDRGLILPLWAAMGPEVVARVAEELLRAVA